MNIGAKKYYGITFYSKNTKLMSHISFKVNLKKEDRDQSEHTHNKSSSNICSQNLIKDNLLRKIISENTKSQNKNKNEDLKKIVFQEDENDELEKPCDELAESLSITDNSKQVLIKAGSMTMLNKNKPSYTKAKKRHNPSHSIAKRLSGYGLDSESHTPNGKLSTLPFTPMGIAKKFTGNLFDTPEKSET